MNPILFFEVVLTEIMSSIVITLSFLRAECVIAFNNTFFISLIESDGSHNLSSVASGIIGLISLKEYLPLLTI